LALCVIESVIIIIIIINGIHIALSSQVATQLGNGAANALKQLRGVKQMSFQSGRAIAMRTLLIGRVSYQRRAICAHKDLHVGGADPCCHGNDIWARRGV